MGTRDSGTHLAPVTKRNAQLGPPLALLFQYSRDQGTVLASAGTSTPCVRLIDVDTVEANRLSQAVAKTRQGLCFRDLGPTSESSITARQPSGALIPRLPRRDKGGGAAAAV